MKMKRIKWGEMAKLWKKDYFFWRHTKPRWLIKYARQDPSKMYEIGEGICAICEKKDYVFPITLHLCWNCLKKMLERKDLKKLYYVRKMDFNGHDCIWCKRRVIVYYFVNTHICNNCTRKLGMKEKEISILRKEKRKIKFI